jgi:Tfp pilus assembly protein PilF
MPDHSPAVPFRRRHLRSIGVGAVIMLAAGGPVMGEPYRPSDDSKILAVVPRSAISKRSEFRSMSRKLAENPADLPTAIAVARLAIDDGRASSDLRSYGQAQAALATWWADAEAPAEARVLKAVILQNLEDYAGAEAALEGVLAKNPQNSEARLNLAFIRQATGKLADARKDCEALPKSPDELAEALCFARIEVLTGAAQQALDRLDKALGAEGEAKPALRALATGLAADSALTLGETEAARRRFAALNPDTADIPLLVAYADFLLDAGEPGEVLKLLADRSEADSVLLRLAIAGKAAGDPRVERWTALLTERFEADRANDVQTHKRERARFELEVKGNAVAALGLARANWKSRKELADARLLLEAALAADDPDSAADVLTFIKTNGVSDARLTPLLAKIAEQK